jgi:hypothetical protein
MLIFLGIGSALMKLRHCGAQIKWQTSSDRDACSIFWKFSLNKQQIYSSQKPHSIRSPPQISVHSPVPIQNNNKPHTLPLHLPKNASLLKNPYIAGRMSPPPFPRCFLLPAWMLVCLRGRDSRLKVVERKNQRHWCRAIL